MSTNPTMTLLRAVLAEIQADALDKLDAPDDADRVSVNGLRVPVVRVAWNKVPEFFARMYDESNLRFFGGELPRCELRWNRRFRNLGGRIDCRQRKLELSSAHFESCGAAALGVVLIHEQIHLSLFEDRRPYGHTAEFKWRSESLGLRSIRHEMPLPSRMVRHRKTHLYQCKCGKIVQSRLRFRRARACAACCDRYAHGRFDPRFVLEYVTTKWMGECG